MRGCGHRTKLSGIAARRVDPVRRWHLGCVSRRCGLFRSGGRGFRCAGGSFHGGGKKPLKQLPASFNARAETVVDKPMFRDAFKRNRCVIPASGYYEWLKGADGRQPYFISAAEGGVLSFASLWDRWKNPETGEPVISCTIIVTDANALTRPIHDRMPVVLDKADIVPWLSGKTGIELLKPAAEDRLRMWPVSRRVNKTGTGDDDPTLIDEVEA